MLVGGISSSVEGARAVKTVTWLANAMQQTAIEEPRVRGVERGGGERALTTFKPSATFERGFKTGSSFKRGFTLKVECQYRGTVLPLYTAGTVLPLLVWGEGVYASVASHAWVCVTLLLLLYSRYRS